MQPSDSHHGKIQDDHCTQLTRKFFDQGSLTGVLNRLGGLGRLIMGLDEEFLVVVHLGAGYHSGTKRDSYLQLCEDTCDMVIEKFLQTERNLIEAINCGIAHLEVRSIYFTKFPLNCYQNSGLVNAGKGSNKNIHSEFELDAGIMISNPFSLAAVCAAKNCPNPISEAKSLLFDVQKQGAYSR